MKILVVEDDELIGQLLSVILSKYRYVVEVVGDGLSAIEMLKAFEFDVVLLDILLPKLGGLEVCKQARAMGIQVPILMLTARDSSQDKAAGLDAGADDYLVKPFDPEELIARVRALLRRGRATQDSVLTLGKLTLNPISFEVAYDQKILPLTPTEYSLLELFLRNPKRVYSCGMILDHVWAHEDTPGEEAVRTHIKGLRQKLKASGAGADLVMTVYGIGYRLKPQNDSNPPTSKSKQVSSQANIPPEADPSNEMQSQLRQLWANYQDTIYGQLNLIQSTIQSFANQTLSAQSRETGLRNAHLLAGSLGTFGLPKGSEIARSIERSLMSTSKFAPSDIEQLQQWMQELRQVIDEKSPSSSEYGLKRPDPVNAILLFDSDRTVANELRQEAKQLGYTLQTSSSLKNAITLVENLSPKAIVLDPSVGESVDKIVNFLEELKTLEPKIPIIIYSEQKSEDLLTLADDISDEHYLQKPVPVNQLLHRIQLIIKQTQVTEATILAVDDDPSILALLKALLEPWGMAIHTLNDPSLFWKTLALVQPDLLILDVEMPIVNGIELCKRLRKDKSWCEIPVIFLSVHSNPEVVNEIFRAGADDYIKKPLVGPELVTRILNRLERNRLIRRLTLNQSSKATSALSSSHEGAHAEASSGQKPISGSLVDGLSPSFDGDLFPKSITSILNIADDAILCVDHQQNIIFFNLGAERIFGYAADEILGQSLDKLIPLRYIRNHREHVKKFASTQRQAKQMGERQEVYGQRQDGTEFPAEASIAKTGQGEQALYTVILRDITLRKQMEEKKSEFISVVSHELRTPLTAVIGALDLLARGLQNNDDPQETDILLSIAQDSTERLVRLVNSVLDDGRIDLGHLELSLKSHNLALIAEDAVSALHLLTASHGVTIETDLHSVNVLVDRDRIFQVLTNLLRNAIHFSPEGKTIFLKLSAVSRQAQIEVIDQGPGIQSEKIDYIFERFYQTDLSQNRDGHKMGLSLATCQSVIKQHHGSIWVESEEGKGSHFFVTLPLEQQSQAQTADDHGSS